jgi:hypothetical protein
MKARVKDQKVKETGKEANKAERLQKKGKGQKVGGRFVFSCEGLSKTLPDGRPLFTDLSFSLYERYAPVLAAVSCAVSCAVVRVSCRVVCGSPATA